MISYEGLLQQLEKRGKTKSQMARDLAISSRTIAKIGKGEPLSQGTLNKIAAYLGCDPRGLCREVSPNAILQLLRDEKAAHISGGLYHELQVRLTYNSNHIEGSRLDEDQTRMIFETNTLDVGGAVPVDDILETVHHFRAIDYVLDVAEQPLSEQIIKRIHYLLKQSTHDSTLACFAVGDYKRRANVIGGKETTPPQEVAQQMGKLVADYNAIEHVQLQDILAFHVKFERIHPFQDGNGRVGRLIAFKECLRHNILPFIIEDSKKVYYYRGLAEWGKENGYLLETCLDGQDTFKKLLDMFEIAY